MSRKFLFIYLFCIAIGGHAFTSAAPINKEAKENSSEDHSHKHKRIRSCEYVISSHAINKGKTVVIDKPGVWCLDGNAVFNPKPSNLPHQIHALFKQLFE